MKSSPINKDTALAHLLDLLSVEGLTGQEAKVVEAISNKLIKAGCKKSWITTDDAHKRLGDGYEVEIGRASCRERVCMFV